MKSVVGLVLRTARRRVHVDFVHTKRLLLDLCSRFRVLKKGVHAWRPAINRQGVVDSSLYGIIFVYVFLDISVSFSASGAPSRSYRLINVSRESLLSP